MRKTFTLLTLIICFFSLDAQIKRWDMLFDPYANSLYYAGSQTPADSWKTQDFPASENWKNGHLPIGFGDLVSGCTDCFKIPATTTIYTRTKFSIKDTTQVENLLLYIDYMDGFAAYINGVEVLRKNLGSAGSATVASQTSDSTHMIESFSREVYTGFMLDKNIVKACLRNGENVLAIELHNDATDVSQAVFFALLYAGLNVETLQYAPANVMFPFPAGNDSSALPIAKLSFKEKMIPDEERITADLHIVDNETTNYFSDTNYTFSGKITIERRGSASQGFSKHSYGFTTIDEAGNDTSVSLLGLPKENDWILKGELEDRTMLRDVLTFDLARKMGRYAPRSRFCELYINGTHMGLFAIMEKVKRDTFRVDIAKLKDSDNLGLDVTGGYLLKIDKATGGYSGGFQLKYKAPLQSIRPMVQFEYPKADKITAAQKSYITNHIHEFEDVLHSDNYKHKTEGYRKYISVKSFIDYMISQELARNVDGYRISTFLYKEKDKVDKKGKIHMGPLWDFNLAYGYSGTLCGGKWSDEGWGYDYNKDCQGDSYYIPFWWDRLLQDPDFRSELKSRWDELRNSVLHEDRINTAIDSLVSANQDGITKNNLIWNDLFRTGIWPNNPVANDYNGEILYLKNFIKDRLAWLDAHIPEIREEIIYTSAPSLTLKIGQVTAYPVPFDNQLNISFYTEAGNDVRLKVYNTSGQLLYQTNEITADGQNILQWNGTSSSGSNINSGIYIYTLEINNEVVARNRIIKK